MFYLFFALHCSVIPNSLCIGSDKDTRPTMAYEAMVCHRAHRLFRNVFSWVPTKHNALL